MDEGVIWMHEDNRKFKILKKRAWWPQSDVAWGCYILNGLDVTLDKVPPDDHNIRHPQLNPLQDQYSTMTILDSHLLTQLHVSLLRGFQFPLEHNQSMQPLGQYFISYSSVLYSLDRYDIH
jgi:hypothetical protein